MMSAISIGNSTTLVEDKLLQLVTCYWDHEFGQLAKWSAINVMQNKVVMGRRACIIEILAKNTYTSKAPRGGRGARGAKWR